MPYKLTLTKSERDAIDWVGNRYSHGDDLFKLLLDCTDAEWSDPEDITFQIPENVAWQISEIIDEGLDCFASDLCNKLYNFQEKIV